MNNFEMGATARTRDDKVNWTFLFRKCGFWAIYGILSHLLYPKKYFSPQSRLPDVRLRLSQIGWSVDQTEQAYVLFTRSLL